MLETKRPLVTERFLDPEAILRAIPLAAGMTVADFGCGNGYYAVAAGSLVGDKGQVYAIDVMEDALSQTATLSKLVGLRNITTMQANLEKFGSAQIPSTTADLVILASILHQAENKDNIVKEAYRVLKTGGKAIIVEWTASSKFGPAVNERLDQKTIENLFEKHGLRPLGDLPAGSFHYALLYQK